MKYRVEVSAFAQGDLIEIHAYVRLHDGLNRADAVLGELEAVIEALDALPKRGIEPPEISGQGQEILQIHHGPWRILYRIVGTMVIVTMVIDGRRDVESLLIRRLLNERQT